MRDVNAHLTIIPAAHGYNYTIFDEIQSFANSSNFHTIVVTQEEVLSSLSSRISVSPARKRCEAEFLFGTNQFHYLPEDYLRYEIIAYNGVTDEDITTILLWKQARLIHIEANTDVAYRLSMHIDALKQMQVESLYLPQEQNTTEQLDPNIFIDNMKRLRVLSISNLIHKFIDRNVNGTIEEEPQAINRYNETIFETYDFKTIDARPMDEYASATDAQCLFQRNSKYLLLLA